MCSLRGKGLALQKTQIGGSGLAPAGAFDVSYHRYGSRVKTSGETEKSFFDGVDVSLEGIATLAPRRDSLVAAGAEDD